MGFNVDDFSSRLNQRGVAKQSNFEAWVSFPARMTFPVGGAAAVSTLGFRADTAEIPGRSIQTITYKPYGGGLTHKIGYDVTYPEVTMSFICGTDLAEKVLFTAWQSLVIGKHNTNQPYQRNMKIGYYKDYIGTVVINQYSEEGELSHQVTLVEVYPTIVNSMPLSWASEDVHRVTVQFSYLHFIESSVPYTPAPALNFSNAGNNIRSSIRNSATNLLVGGLNNAIGNATGGGVSVSTSDINVNLSSPF